MPHTFVRPARLRFHSTDLATDVIRTFGYQGRCACGWVGSIRHEHSTARKDGREHRQAEHDSESATRGTEAS